MSVWSRTVQPIALLCIAGTMLGQLAHMLEIYGFGDLQDTCGASARWSMADDCLRRGLILPAAISASLCLLASARAWQLMHTHSAVDQTQTTALRRPAGKVTVHDRRSLHGFAVVLASIAQFGCFAAWQYSTEQVPVDDGGSLLVLSMLFTSMLVMMCVVYCLGKYINSRDRLSIAGVFPGQITMLVSVQLLVGLAEVYFALFTDTHADVPMWGKDATLATKYLVTSTMLSLMLLVLLLCVQRRALYIRPDNTSSTALNMQVSTDATNDTPLTPSRSVRISQLVDSPEHSVSWLGSLLFTWPTGILSKGARGQLDNIDLYNTQDIEQPIESWSRFQEHRSAGRTLTISLLLTFWRELTQQAVLSVIACLMRFAVPFFLQRILRTIETAGQGKPVHMRVAYMNAVGILVFAVAESVLSARVMWAGRCIGIRVKSLLIAVLSTKTLERRANGGAVSEEGNDDNDDDSSDGKVMNILTADFQAICEMGAYLDALLSMPLLLCTGIWYMYQLLGVSALVGVVVILVYSQLSKRLFGHLGKIEDDLATLSDYRVATISELVQGIKAVKLFGWEQAFLKRVDEKRDAQLCVLWRVLLVWAAIFPAGMLAPMLVLLSIFGTYVVWFGNSLTAELAFTSITVFQITEIVFEHFPTIMSGTVTGYVSLRRVDSYLSQPQVQSLEERVSESREEGKLGFADADLVWDINASAKGALDSATEQSPLLASHPQSTYSSLDTGKQADGGLIMHSLRSISVIFPPGGLTVVAGPTGSGKTSLLSALIGEMTLIQGKIHLPTVNPRWVSRSGRAEATSPYSGILELSEQCLAIRDIAYVAQEAWLRNATIRENILFGEPYNQERYEEVLRVCALKPDLRILSAGDQTEIGERGVTLSGGQKQRVALARAVYSSRKILLIDDCLSAVDAHTAKHILNECLLSKTALMQGRTCVLVTHHVSLCVPQACYMVVMREGRIAVQGHPQELLESGKLSGLDLGGLESPQSSTPASTTSLIDRTEDTRVAAVSRQLAAVNDCTSEDEYTERRQRMLTEHGGRGLITVEGTLVEEEERESGSVKLSVWMSYFKACGSLWFWLAMFGFLAAAQMMQVFQVYWIRLWITSTTNPKDNSSSSRPTHSSVFWLAMYCLIGMSAALLKYVYMYISSAGSLKASRTIHSQLIRSIIHAVPRFFDTTPLGRIVNRFARDMTLIDENAMDNIAWWLMDTAGVVAVFAIIITIMPTFILIAMVISVVYMSIAYYYLAASRELKRLESTSLSPLMSLFGEMIQGTGSIRAFGAQKYYIKESLTRISAHCRPFYLVWATNRWLSMRVDWAGAVVSFTCIMMALANMNSVDAALAGFVLSYALTFSDRMIWVIRSYAINELNMNAVERINQYLEVEQEADGCDQSGSVGQPGWPRTGTLDVEDLVVEYVPGVPVLHGISFAVRSGEKIGVVGRTGAGKSSLSLALLRLIEATSGKIILDGVDISKISLEDLRRNVTIIPQDPVLFNGTIRFNLDPFDEYPDELVWDALRRAHLVHDREHTASNSSSLASINNACDQDSAASAMEHMSGVFTSLEAEIKEHGQNLSQGQRQLVALARALVRRSKLIIMDEATASVDFDTDKRIQRTIRGSEFSQSTLLCVAHRLRTIIDYDRVLVLDQGRIAEFGTPYDLLHKEDSAFRALCQRSNEFEYLLGACQMPPDGGN